MSIKKLFALFLLLLLIFPFSAQVMIAKADDLIIQDDGKVILVITNNNGVLGESTAKNIPIKESPKPAAPAQKSNPPPPPPSHPASQTPAKVVPLVPPHAQSTVQINPPINNDKKMQVTITTEAAPKTPQPITNQAAKTSPTGISANSKTSPKPTAPKTSPTIVSPKSTSFAPSNVVSKTVDQVVAQGSNGQPVLTIKSDQARQLTIQQGHTQVTTALPLQIDTLTHSLSVPSSNASTKVSVLPTEALQGILEKGSLSAQDITKAKINLTKDETGVNYTVQGEKKGKLFGIFDVNSPVQVKLSAQNGKVVNTSQSLLFNTLGGFIK
ncbi:MAG: hypothetical protein M1372_00165 [Patescibacteria group bacterium]|nr:hypothetical protein [Patescibacteria group bacterium]